MNEYQKRVLEARKGIIKLTLEQQKEIQKIYEDMSKNLIPQILNMKDCRTKIHQIEIYKILNQYQTKLHNKLNDSITGAINKAASIETGVQLSFVDMIAPNVKIKEALNRTITNISSKTVEQLIAGNYYKDGKTLNKRIWGYTERNYSQIDKIIKSNIAKGANVKELAKDLNSFVRPSAKTTASVNRLGLDNSICYQAQRLARTSITHAQTEVKIQNAKKNPFCKGLRWCLSSSHERDDICDNYEGRVFEPDDVPLQHPNCMCYFEDVLEDMDDAIDRINKWAEGAEDKELDKWSTEFNSNEDNSKNSINESVKVNGKDGIIDIKMPQAKNSENIDDKKYNIIKSDFETKKINKRFDYSISNVNWNNTLGITLENSNILNNVHTNLNKFIIDTNTEKLSIINLKDSVIVKELTSDLQERIIPDKEMLRILKNSNSNDLILTHNHIGETTFSSGDISFIIKYKSINALTLECSNGIKYIMQRDGLKSSMFKEYNFINIYRKIFDKIKKKYPITVNEDEAIWNKFLHEVNIEVSKKYGIKYKRIEGN